MGDKASEGGHGNLSGISHVIRSDSATAVQFIWLVWFTEINIPWYDTAIIDMTKGEGQIRDYDLAAEVGYDGAACPWCAGTYILGYPDTEMYSGSGRGTS